MRSLEEIRNHPAMIKELIERWNEQENMFQFKGFIKTKYSRRHARATVKFTHNKFGWDHLSVSFDDETPSWECMQEMKEIFFKDDEVCIQIHPKKEEYINNHPHCLHMWHYLEGEVPTPDYLMIGFRGPEYKEEDIDRLILMQAKWGHPMTREHAEALYAMSDPKLSEQMRKLNVAWEKGNLNNEISKLLGGLK